MGINGADPTQLTNCARDTEPVFTPDGKWLLYKSSINNKHEIWRIAASGGPATQLVDADVNLFALSPDGRLLAFTYYDESSKDGRLVIRQLDGGPRQQQTLSAIGQYVLRWATDSRSLYFNRDNGSNIYQ